MAARTRIRRGKYAMWSRIVLVSAAGFATVAALAGLFAWHVTSQFVAEEAWLTRNHALVEVLTANYQPVSRGRGYVRHLVIFGVQDDRVESQFSGSVGAKVTSLRELRKAIREGHVSDNTRDASGHY